MRDEPARRTLHRVLRTAAVVLLASLAHLALARVSHGLATPAEPAPFWFPAGLDVALVVLFGRRAWPGVLAGDALAWLAQGALPLATPRSICGKAMMRRARSGCFEKSR